MRATDAGSICNISDASMEDRSMTDTTECRPAAGTADGSLHWLKPANHAAQIWWWEAGEWRDRIGYARSPQVQAQWGYAYHLPASPDDATERARLADENARLREALEWYGEQARLCRLIHSEGDPGRHALADDGGKRATAAVMPGDAS
jgi:hypothetical protein